MQETFKIRTGIKNRKDFFSEKEPEESKPFQKKQLQKLPYTVPKSLSSWTPKINWTGYDLNSITEHINLT